MLQETESTAAPARIDSDDLAYQDLVVADVSSKLEPQQRAVLMEDPERWYLALVALYEDLQAQATRRKAEFVNLSNSTYNGGEAASRLYHDERARYFDWRARVSTFRTHVQRRLTEVKAYRTQQREMLSLARHESRAIQQARELRQRYHGLLTAVGKLISADQEDDDAAFDVVWERLVVEYNAICQGIEERAAERGEPVDRWATEVSSS